MTTLNLHQNGYRQSRVSPVRLRALVVNMFLYVSHPALPPCLSHFLGQTLCVPMVDTTYFGTCAQTRTIVSWLAFRGRMCNAEALITLSAERVADVIAL